MMKNLRAQTIALMASQLVIGMGSVQAEQKSISPYIDQQKAKMEQEGKPSSDPARTAENPDPYIQSIRKKMLDSGKAVEPAKGTQPYIDHLKAENPSLNEAPKSAGFAEEEKSKLPPEERGSAIQAYHEGKSDLYLKRPGKIDASVGFKMAASVSHDFTGNPSFVANQFSDIYGNKWVPDITLQGEYKPFYSETFGSLGFIGSAGFGIFKANARFANQIPLPSGTGFFPLTARTKLTFLSIPVTLGVKYQFNLSHIIRPYAVAAPTLVGISENRNDGISAKKALSKGLTTTVGAAFLLDWISGGNSWNLYQDFGIKHYYLTVEYTKLTTISSPVDVSYSGLNAGFAFDF
ncbi:MAG: hypothetical protein ACJ763_02945 [Bdellovibrionia bacterium]